MLRSWYKSVDIEEDLLITLEPMDRLLHMRGHFGVVFHAQSNAMRSQYKLADMRDDLFFITLIYHARFNGVVTVKIYNYNHFVDHPPPTRKLLNLSKPT